TSASVVLVLTPPDGVPSATPTSARAATTTNPTLASASVRLEDPFIVHLLRCRRNRPLPQTSRRAQPLCVGTVLLHRIGPVNRVEGTHSEPVACEAMLSHGRR